MAVQTLTFDQVHLGVPDPDAAARWYVDRLGASPGEAFDRVWFGDVRVIFLKNAAPAPSDGAAIDHFALSFADVAAAAQTLAHAGVRVTTPVSMAQGLGRYAYVEDPWGTKIQLVEDPDAPGFHHVHLRVPDPEQTRAWYLERLGGTRARHKGTLDGLQYGRVWLFLDAGAAPPSRGRAIDHVGWRMPDLLAKAAELRHKGVAFTVEPKPGPSSPGAPVLMSFTEDPWGVKIELLQRPPDRTV
jgi:catechol 2,3-dioxygenase-like lactoylglutathione lyase family enzyme